MFCGKCGYPISDGERICPRCGREARSAGSRRAKKAAAVLIISAVLLALVGGGLFFAQVFYADSDAYIISKAENQILDGNYEEGLRLIEDIKSDSADAVRQFTELLKLRDSYAEAFKPEALQTADDPLKLCYDRLREAHSAFSLGDKLPEKLRERWDRYNVRVTGMSGALTNLTAEELADAQICVLSFGERKRGGSFTTTDLENVITVSEPALKAIDEKLLQNKDYKKFREGSKAQAVKATQELYDAASSQLEQDKFDLNEYLGKGKAGVTLRLNSVDENYRADVGKALSPLGSLSDTEENAGRLYTALCYAWMAYSYDIK